MGPKNKPSYHNVHHLRPTSRGGNESTENRKTIHKKNVHDPYHWLFTNLRPHEIALLFIFSWKTQYIPNLDGAFDEGFFTAASSAWHKLFKESSDIESALAPLQNIFVSSEEDKALMEWVLRLGACEMSHTITEAKASVEERKKWHLTPHRSYTCLFGHLDPHEALLITFLSWETVCPYMEFSTPATNGVERGSMKRRLKAWNMLFGEKAGPWDAVRIIENLCIEADYPQTYALVQEAIAICEAIKKSQ